MIPPIVRISLLEVENPQLRLIQMMQKDSRDLHFNLSETAKATLKAEDSPRPIGPTVLRLTTSGREEFGDHNKGLHKRIARPD